MAKPVAKVWWIAKLLNFTSILLVFIVLVIAYDAWPLHTVRHFVDLIEAENYEAISRLIRGHDEYTVEDWRYNFSQLDPTTLLINDRTASHRLTGTVTFSLYRSDKNSGRRFEVQRGRITSIGVITFCRSEKSPRDENESSESDP